MVTYCAHSRDKAPYLVMVNNDNNEENKKIINKNCEGICWKFRIE